MKRHGQQRNNGCLYFLLFGVVIGIFVLLYKMMKLRGPWKYIFLGLLAFAIATYAYFGWTIGAMLFFIAMPILGWVSDYLTNEQTNLTPAFIVVASVIWTVIFLVLFLGDFL